MKRFSSLFLVLCLTAVLGGCQKAEKFETPDSVYMFATADSVDSPAGVKSVTIFTTCSWTASTDTPWITDIDPSSGEGAGITAVHFTYEENTTGEDRVGKVTFVAGTYTETYSLTQRK